MAAWAPPEVLLLLAPFYIRAAAVLPGCCCRCVLRRVAARRAAVPGGEVTLGCWKMAFGGWLLGWLMNSCLGLCVNSNTRYSTNSMMKFRKDNREDLGQWLRNELIVRRQK